MKDSNEELVSPVQAKAKKGVSLESPRKKSETADKYSVEYFAAILEGEMREKDEN
jgi:hypothetical protein